MPVVVVVAGVCLAALVWLLRAVARAFLCMFLVIYPTPSLLAVLVMALVLLCFR